MSDLNKVYEEVNMVQSYKPVKLYSEDSEGIATEVNLETCLELVKEGLLEYYSLTETHTPDEMMDTQYAFEAIQKFVLAVLTIMEETEARKEADNE